MNDCIKIAFVSPCNRDSAIARVNATIVPLLIARGHEVLVVASERDRLAPNQIVSMGSKVRHWREVDPKELHRTTDLVIVTIGDNFLFHAGIFAFLRHGPCLGIFHDFYLRNLFNGWLETQDRLAHDREVRAIYEPARFSAATLARHGALPIGDMVRDVPMTEWIASQCGAALAHAQFYASRLDDACAGPVRVTHLCLPPRHVRPLRPRTPRDDLIVMTVGLVNPNKCADLVIRAIGNSRDLRSRAHYRLVGPITIAEQTRLETLAKSIGFSNLTCMGAVTDLVLEDQISQADVMCCLRHPVLEGASASAIEAIMSGRPTIVMDDGFYAELPSDLVFKIPLAGSEASLTHTLERLMHDVGLGQTVGQNAAGWAQQTFTAERYVDDLEPLARSLLAIKPHFQLAAKVADHLTYLGIGPEDPSITWISAHLQEMFGSE